jgi:hypothetical protein
MGPEEGVLVDHAESVFIEAETSHRPNPLIGEGEKMM